MAAVYAATHRNGKRVAVKMLHPELSRDGEARRRFVDEGYVANRVGHPGVVSILDDDIARDGAAFLVMDLLEGETLDIQVTRKGRLEPLELLALMDDLLDVLAAAHAKGIVHRDVKPNNIFVTRRGQVKLLDFGIARLADPSHPRTDEPGMTMGTPAFMPPEQARGQAEQLDGRTDLWAVGATMFMALTGGQVHEAESASEELLAAMTRTAPSLGSVAPDLPVALIGLVDRALAFRQENRWPDAAAMQCALREVHASIIEKGAASQSARDPLVSLEDLAPPAASHSPVTLQTVHPLALSQNFDVDSEGSPLSRRRARSRLAVGALVLSMVGLALAGRTYGPATGEHAALSNAVESPRGAPASPTEEERSDPPEPPAGNPGTLAGDALVTNEPPAPASRPRARTTAGKPAIAATPRAAKAKAGPPIPSASAVTDPLDRRK
jgi:serine/threonine protein kinase